MKALDLVPELRGAVMAALDAPYSSFSSTDESETGNRYQAVGMGGFTTRGLREGRDRFLDVLDLRGKRVLDLGSNLGEISRQARLRGARLVDGFEYDPYFIEVANLVNVAADTTRVSFFECDISDPGIYAERYDVVLAFSVMRFIIDCLDRLAEITDVVVFEGHTLSGNFEERYMSPLLRWFPAYRVLGESDSTRVQEDDVRPVMLLACDEQALLGALAPRLRGPGRAAGAMAAGSRARGIRGGFDRVSVEDGVVHVEGWCLDPEGHDLAELGAPADGQAVPLGTRAVAAVSEPRERPDVAAAHPDLPHAGGAGFRFEYPLVNGVGERVRFDVTAYRGSRSLGTISAWHMDGMYESMPAPPPALAERRWGTADPRRLALASLAVASAMLEPIARYRRTDSFEAVLDWQCGLGLLVRHVARLLPAAMLTGVDTDTEALEWARTAGLPGSFEELPETPPTSLPAEGFDLVLGYGALSQIRPAAQPAWLEELHRITAPGAYLAVTFLGELAVRFLPDRELAEEILRRGCSSEPMPIYLSRSHAIAACGQRFDVVSYVEGGVAGLHDLIVLRRP
jgi:SAM-dependent methyltransferase